MNREMLQSDQWEPCTPGELQRVVTRIKTHERRLMLKQLGGGAAGVLVLGVGGYLASQYGPRSSQQRYGGIACSEVMRLMPRYRARELSAELTRKIQIHVAECPRCGKMARESSA